MKFKNLLVALIIGAGFCLGSIAGEIQIGDSRESVLATMGEPTGKAALGDQEVFCYQNGRITLKNGRVAIINLKPKEECDIKNRSALGRDKVFSVKKYGLADTNVAVVVRNKCFSLISLPGAETQSFKVNDRWEVRIGFLNGVAQRMTYVKSYQQGEQFKIMPDEFSAVLNAQADGLSWEKT